MSIYHFKNSSRAGIDLVDVSRFRQFEKDREHHFLLKTFSTQELNYCFEYSDPAPHLAGIFAAKEATSKAFGVQQYPYAKIEVRHDGDGRPEPYFNGKKLPCALSITHTDTTAAAIAVG